MTLSKSFIRNAATTPLDARLMNMASIVSHSTGEPRVGVIGTGPTALVTTTGTMNVAVGIAEFATSKGKADGVAIFANDGAVNVPIAAAPVSNSRIDVIWVKHNDDTTGDANALPIFGVTAGTAAASPTKPAISVTGALELATLRIYSGTTATNGGTNLLTNTYDMTAARGGSVPFRTKADLDAWTTPQAGQIASVTSDPVPALNGAYIRRGSSWTRAFPQTAQQIDATNSLIDAVTEVGRGKLTGNNTVQVTKAVTFPTPFASVPTVTASAIGYRNTGAYNESGLSASLNFAAVIGVTATGFTLVMTQTGGANLLSTIDYYYSWIAVGVPAV